MKPGSISLPSRSSTVVPGPASFLISAVDPTERIRSPRTATASARGFEESTVQTDPFTNIVSATCCPNMTNGTMRNRKKRVFIGWTFKLAEVRGVTRGQDREPKTEMQRAEISAFESPIECAHNPLRANEHLNQMAAREEHRSALRIPI